ncbi:elongation factor G, mitochondrial [Lactarius akahatsu]|uniref:Elongation factor 2 n=1 Tax=Lactarius akahatsu TaxID=416441 RepID=A0AAD4L7E1_9AGAM|nr:elongation factor G, mitochondrial [Lactarius akahatsu]
MLSLPPAVAQHLSLRFTRTAFSFSSLSRSYASAATAAARVVPQTAGETASLSPAQRFPLTEADRHQLKYQRNIGVSAHIDSGKTTLTERILYYTGRIRDIHEVRGKDNVGAKMDSMELEREKGITIQSAATFCDWNAKSPSTGELGKVCDQYNRHAWYVWHTFLFPPSTDGCLGHVDFTIEVERALRVLDGAVLVLCAVSGVQVSSPVTTLHVPALTDLCWFSDPACRPGANPWRVINQIRTKLLQVPIGVEDQLEGVVDLVRWKAVYNKGAKGNSPTAIRRATVSLKFSPVFLGSAVKNTAVQPLLDGVCAYLASPSERQVVAHDTTQPAGAAQVELVPAAAAPLVALAFKLEEGRFGQLTYMRVYQGSLKKGPASGIKVPKLVRMHSNEMEDIESIGPGEICAIFGVECATGDTFTDGTTNYSMPIKPVGTETPNFSRALNRFQKEDPTFRVHIDHESKETIISGMGELHLEIYVERMKREYGVACTTGRPQVAFRETVTERADFAYTHKKQTGGAGQYARVIGHVEPMEMDTDSGKDTEFESVVMGGNVPSNYIPAVEKGFFEALEKGTLSGNPISGVRMVLRDGAFHAVDSSELAFRLAAIGAFREAYLKTKPVILEPIMTVEVVAPVEFQSAVIGGLNARRGTIIDSEVREDEFTAVAEVALNDMFGYSSQLRGATQGKGEFSMEYKNHMPVLPNVQVELQDAYRKSLPHNKK